MSFFESFLIFHLVEAISKVFVIIAIAFLVTSVIFLAMRDSAEEKKKKDALGVKAAKAVIVVPFFMVLATLTPDKATLLQVVGAHYVTNVDGVVELPEKIIKATNAALDQLANDIVEGD